jgi:hypothetical protein
MLEFFCSDAEHASIAGDLTEQYQAGRSNYWYNRQVLGIVFLSIFHKIVRRPLMRAHSFATGENTLLSFFLLAWAFMLSEMAGKDILAVIAVLAPLWVIGAGALLYWKKFSTVKYQALGLVEKK